MEKCVSAGSSTPLNLSKQFQLFTRNLYMLDFSLISHIIFTWFLICFNLINQLFFMSKQTFLLSSAFHTHVSSPMCLLLLASLSRLWENTLVSDSSQANLPSNSEAEYDLHDKLIVNRDLYAHLTCFSCLSNHNRWRTCCVVLENWPHVCVRYWFQLL